MIVSATYSFSLCLQAGLITMQANIIVHQQVAAPAIKGWNTGLFDCCQDMNSCEYPWDILSHLPLSQGILS